MSAAERHRPAALRMRLSSTLRILLPLLVLGTPPVASAAAAIIPVVFGEQFTSVSGIIRIMLWVLPLFALNTLLTTFFQASHRQGRVVLAMGCGLILSAAVSVPLAILLGGVGVATAMVLSEATILVVLFCVLQRADRAVVTTRHVLALGVCLLAVGLSVAGSLLQWPHGTAYLVAGGALVVLLVFRLVGTGEVVEFVRGFVISAGSSSVAQVKAGSSRSAPEEGNGR